MRLALFLMFAVVSSSLLASFSARADADSPWLNNVDQAFAEAGKTGKPIFAVVLCFH